MFQQNCKASSQSGEGWNFSFSTLPLGDTQQRENAQPHKCSPGRAARKFVGAPSWTGILRCSSRIRWTSSRSKSTFIRSWVNVSDCRWSKAFWAARLSSNCFPLSPKARSSAWSPALCALKSSHAFARRPCVCLSRLRLSCSSRLRKSKLCLRSRSSESASTFGRKVPTSSPVNSAMALVISLVEDPGCCVSQFHSKLNKLSIVLQMLSLKRKDLIGSTDTISVKEIEVNQNISCLSFSFLSQHLTPSTGRPLYIWSVSGEINTAKNLTNTSNLWDGTRTCSAKIRPRKFQENEVEKHTNDQCLFVWFSSQWRTFRKRLPPLSMSKLHCTPCISGCRQHHSWPK